MREVAVAAVCFERMIGVLGDASVIQVALSFHAWRCTSPARLTQRYVHVPQGKLMRKLT